MSSWQDLTNLHPNHRESQWCLVAVDTPPRPLRLLVQAWAPHLSTLPRRSVAVAQPPTSSPRTLKCSVSWCETTTTGQPMLPAPTTPQPQCSTPSQWTSSHPLAPLLLRAVPNLIPIPHSPPFPILTPLTRCHPTTAVGAVGVASIPHTPLCQPHTPPWALPWAPQHVGVGAGGAHWSGGPQQPQQGEEAGEEPARAVRGLHRPCPSRHRLR